MNKSLNIFVALQTAGKKWLELIIENTKKTENVDFIQGSDYKELRS